MESAAIQKPAASTLTHCNGTKQCRHKVNGPSMRKRAMQESASDLDDGIHVPGVRGKTVLKPQDVIEKCVGKATCSKSWKDQSKAKRQYACHKAWGHHKDPDKDCCCVWHSLAEAGFPVSVGILADCA